MSVAVQPRKPGRKNRPAVRLMTPRFIEYGFYVSLVYGIMGPLLGLQIDRLGIVFLAGLACLCFLGFRERPVEFFRTLAFPMGLGISYLIIQLMYHGLSISAGYVKPFIPWLFTLIVVQALSFRAGFFHRFVIFALLLGGMLLFFLDFRASGDEVIRVGLDRDLGGLSNPNAFASWFGFCTVYFFVFGIVAKRQKVRITSWIIATSCLFVVTLTVSRGALFATIIGIVLGSREFLKRGFIPLLLLCILAWIAYGVGVFDQTISYYMTRATEKTGRFLVWPRAFEAFMNSPLTGVGANAMQIFLPEKAKVVTPHNSFLFIAMASGIFPLIFYAAYWIQATWGVIKELPGKTDTAAFLLPLVGYAFLSCLTSNMNFMESWVIVTLVASVTLSTPNRAGVSKIIRHKKIPR